VCSPFPNSGTGVFRLLPLLLGWPPSPRLFPVTFLSSHQHKVGVVVLPAAACRNSLRVAWASKIWQAVI